MMTDVFTCIYTGSGLSLMSVMSQIRLKVGENKRMRKILSPSSGNTVIGLRNYVVRANKIPLPWNVSLEGPLSSWCTNERCEISPRTFYHVSETRGCR